MVLGLAAGRSVSRSVGRFVVVLAASSRFVVSLLVCCMCVSLFVLCCLTGWWVGRLLGIPPLQPQATRGSGCM